MDSQDTMHDQAAQGVNPSITFGNQDFSGFQSEYAIPRSDTTHRQDAESLRLCTNCVLQGHNYEGRNLN